MSTANNLEGILQFIREAERLKNTLRSSYSSTGRRESVPEHTWRLCLMAMVLESYFPEVDMAHVIQMCIIHDLGEAINGDIPAPKQHLNGNKSASERKDLLQLMTDLPDEIREKILGFWDEYEQATTPEAKTAKALDKLETILQHNQGQNPEEFDYAYNLEYGKKYTSDHPVIKSLRRQLDKETRKLGENKGDQSFKKS